MEAYGLEPQVALTTPLLLGTDGEKMSKSKGNTIGLTDAPEEQFGRTMRISDELLPDYYRLVMERDPAEIGDDPMAAKLRLARYVVARSHGESAAAAAEEHFARVVRRNEAPEDVPCVVLSADDVDGADVYLPGRPCEIHGDLVGERGETADRPGRRQAGRSARRRAQRAGGSADGIARPGRQAPRSRPSCRRATSPESRLDMLRHAAIILRLPHGPAP